ncbi:MAG: hypothetical protein ACSW8J_06205 [bacterium]
MVGKQVEHIRFGQGVVTAFAPPRLDVRFEGEAQDRRFSYPAVTSRFLRFIDADAARRARSDLEANDVLTHQEIVEKIEANRRREEELSQNRVDALRKKRADAAKQAAERRKMAIAAKKRMFAKHASEE